MAKPNSEEMLMRLGGSDMAIADPKDDVRSRRIVDESDEEIGVVEDLYVDSEQKVRFLLVSTGGILGLGESKYLIPVEAVTEVDEDVVRISHSRSHVSESPKYDPKVSEDYSSQIYAHFGYPPYWGG